MKILRLLQIFTALLAITFVNSCSKQNDYNFPEKNTTPVITDSITTDSVIKNITYATNANWLGQTEQLQLDIYFPAQQSNVTATKFPLLVWIHGGGFQLGDKETEEDFAKLMTAKGFIVAPINYRLGWTHDHACKGDTTEGNEAIYRAMQDTRAALRYLVAHADQYLIDTSWVFLAGSSAGAATTLRVAYYTQQTADYYFPEASHKIGPLDDGNSLTNTYTLKGLISMWGGLGTPDIITKNNAKPTIFFQGTNDSVVPFNIGHFYSCDNFPVGYGTKPLYEKLISLGVPAVAHVEPGGGHGVYTEDFRVNNCACFLNSLITNTPQTGYYTGEQSNCR